MTARYPRALLLGVAVIGLLVAGCASSEAGSASAAPDGQPVPGSTTTATSQPASSTASATGTVHCDFTSTPSQPAPAGKNVGLPPVSASRSGTASITLHTSQGDIPITMPRANAPCTVASFAFLATSSFFNTSPCHRLTAADTLKVLQCGDPTGTGTGGPGYTIPDENPTNLPAAPVGQGTVVYARGTVAMANTGQPHSGGSQFFLVYADSALPPSYAVFGQVSPAGLAVLDKIAAGGIQNDDGTHDGKPAIPVTITSATVAG
jgi:cyclophilin family peptidyl-prolyl cis-trans isomerase